ncbi:hypothetical protein AMECASPLE_012074 [Ameca splendens]|uniref:Uncharacterized protein n=1 Tax=Ameca splendens TaxID=208324 RepID=A0ABV1A7Q3_9TELE
MKEQEVWIKESPGWNRKYSCQLSLWHMSLPAGSPKDQGEGSWSLATSRPGHASSSPVMPTLSVHCQQLSLCVKPVKRKQTLGMISSVCFCPIFIRLILIFSPASVTSQ